MSSVALKLSAHAHGLPEYGSAPISTHSSGIGGSFGETYSEELTPQYMMPDMTALPYFLCQQLPLLFNELILIRAGGLDAEQSVSGWFYQSFEDLFAKRKVSVPLAFTTICWMKSVSALQGDGGLGSAVSLTISHRWELQDRLEKSISQGGARRDDPVLHKEMKSLLATLQQQKKSDVLLQANPILSGFLQLDNHFQYLQAGCNAVLIT